MDNNEKNSYTSGFTILGHVITVLSIIGWFILIFTTTFTIALFISILSDIFVICIVYGLGSAQTKINRLEDLLYDKKIINAKDVENIDGIANELLNTEGIVLCKNCGYQIFPEETKCSNCGEPKQPTKPKIPNNKK